MCFADWPDSQNKKHVEIVVLDKLPSIERCMNRLDGAEPIDPSCLIAHIHIPKTAGMAVQTVLKEHFEPHTHLQWNKAAENWKELTDGKEYSGSLITGHLQFPQLFYPGFSSERPIYCVSVIRDPLQRVISLYNYNRSLRHPNHERFSARFPSIDDFIKAKSGKDNVRNQQAVWLCGSRTNPDVLCEVLNAHYIGLTTQGYLADYLTKVLKLCGKTAGEVTVPTVNALQKIKSGGAVGRDDIDPVVLEKFFQDNWLDDLLYKTVSKHLERNATPDTEMTAQGVRQVRKSTLARVKQTVKRLLRN